MARLLEANLRACAKQSAAVEMNTRLLRCSLSPQLKTVIIVIGIMIAIVMVPIAIVIAIMTHTVVPKAVVQDQPAPRESFLGGRLRNHHSHPKLQTCTCTTSSLPGYIQAALSLGLAAYLGLYGIMEREIEATIG